MCKLQSVLAKLKKINGKAMPLLLIGLPQTRRNMESRDCMNPKRSLSPGKEYPETRRREHSRPYGPHPAVCAV